MIGSAKYNPADSGASRHKPCEVKHVSLADQQHHLSLRSRHTSLRLPKRTRLAASVGRGRVAKTDSDRENDHEKTLAQGGCILGVASVGGDGGVRGAVESAGSTIGCKQ